MPGVGDVYAAGAVTTWPMKQGGLAAQQADAVAESLAAWAGAPVRPTAFRPVLRGVLLSGSGRRSCAPTRGRTAPVRSRG